MKLTLLGSGDAVGTPKIGCDCPQCLHARATGIQRLRTSLLIEYQDRHILIDSTPDLRQQLLSHNSPHIDAVIWTHGHYDHFMGFGEFYRVQKVPEVFAAPPVIRYCDEIFKFLPHTSHAISPYAQFDLFGLKFTFIEVNHPPVCTCGVVISAGGLKIGYTSDTRADIPQKSLDCLHGADLLFIDAIVPPNYTLAKHMNYSDAVRLAGELGAGTFRCVHLSHMIPWDLPDTGRDGETFCYPDA